MDTCPQHQVQLAQALWQTGQHDPAQTATRGACRARTSGHGARMHGRPDDLAGAAGGSAGRLHVQEQVAVQDVRADGRVAEHVLLQADLRAAA